jgi:hypothetical protein
MAKGPSSPPSPGMNESPSPGPGGGGGVSNGNNSQILGMIVDRSSFDEDSDFGNFVINEEDDTVQSDGVGSGVVMKNGKVRRRLRWKPPSFRKKKSNTPSSNASVISALTNRSSMTNRSNSTSKTFLSGFSRKSTKSFHTFHSTATPVVTNKAGAKTQFPLPRPNYRDTFEGSGSQSSGAHNGITKHSTIDNEGQILQHHRRMGSDKSGFNVDAVDVHRICSLPSRLDSMPPSPVSVTATPSTKNLGSNASVHSDPFDNLELNDAPAAITVVAPPPKPTRKKLFIPRPPRMLQKIGLKKSKEAAAAAAAAAESSSIAEANSYETNSHKSSADIGGVPAILSYKPSFTEQSATHTVPTLATTTSRLSASISLERENSVLPRLQAEDYEQDRRVGLCIGTPPRTRMDYDDDITALQVDQGSEADLSSMPRVPSIRTSPSPTPSSASGAKRFGLSNSPQTTSLDRRARSTVSNSRASPSEAAVTPVPRRQDPPTGFPSPQQHTPQPSPQHPKAYNRPIDTTTEIPRGSEVEITVNHDIVINDETHQNGTSAPFPSNAMVSPSRAPGLIEEGSSFEAEHNLRAIHDMAAEHLAHGEFAEAIEVFEEILRGQQQRYGHNHYRVGTALHNLGIVHLKSGDHKKAIDICSQAVKVRRESLVPDHPDVAVSLAQLGVAHLECRQYERALMAFREALHIRQSYLGPKHPKCSKILNNIGCAMYSLDELEGSRLAFQEALDIQRETLRTMPPPGTSAGEDGHEMSATSQSNQILLSIASTLCNIGSIRLRWGQFDDAGVALEEALLVGVTQR